MQGVNILLILFKRIYIIFNSSRFIHLIMVRDVSVQLQWSNNILMYFRLQCDSIKTKVKRILFFGIQWTRQFVFYFLFLECCSLFATVSFIVCILNVLLAHSNCNDKSVWLKGAEDRGVGEGSFAMEQRNNRWRTNEQNLIATRWGYSISLHRVLKFSPVGP